jgi:hypothetical protein
MYYKVLEELPKIPDYLVKENLSFKNSRFSDLKFHEIDHEKKIFPRTPVTEAMAHWLRNNITNESTSMDIAITYVESKSVRMYPHTDSSREWTLMYLLKHGGENHRTVFYKHRNPDFVLAPQMNFEYDEIIEVDSIQIPLKTWAIVNAQEIHSVENIPGVRIAFQLGMQHNPWN